MDLAKAESLAMTLMEKHGLFENGFIFQWDRSIRVLGRCRTRHKEGKKELFIILSEFFVSNLSEEEVRDTILHEIAHALDYLRSGKQWRRSSSGKKLAHDAVWKNICLEIGAKPDRLYKPSADFSIPKIYRYELIDQRTGKVLKKFEKKPRKNYSKYSISGDMGSINQLVVRKIPHNTE